MKTKFDFFESEIHQELPKLKYITDSTGVLMYQSQSMGIIPGFEKYAAEIENFTGLKAVYMMINCIPPGIEVGTHTDTLVGGQFQRYHIALETNAECYLELEEEAIHVKLHEWCGPISYWLPHRVGNRGTTERTHLIVDLK